jgi:hypothetical protein
MYPNPAEFVVEISASGRKDKDTARDAVSNASPELYWNSSLYESKIAPYINSGININNTIDISYSLSSANKIIISSSIYGNVLRSIDKFYNGCILSFPSTTIGGVFTNYQIQNYKNIDNFNKELKLYKNFTTSVTGLNTFITIFNQYIDKSIFIPSGSDIDNFYSNYYLQKIDTTTIPPTYDTRKIITYDGNTHNCILDNSISSWDLSNSNIIIRKELPLKFGNILGVNSNGVVIQIDTTSSNIHQIYSKYFLRMTSPIPYISTTNTVTNKYINEYGFLTAGSIAGTNICFLSINSCTIDNFYNGFTINNTSTGESRTITSYIGSSRQCILNTPWGGFTGNSYNIDNIYISHSISDPTPPYGEERKIISYITGDGIFSNIGGVSFTLNTTDTTDLNGCFITDTTVNVTRYINSYNVSTKSGTVSTAWSGAENIGDNYSVRTVFLASPFSVSPNIGDSYEIEGFSYDNWNPFSYIGSLTSSQEMVCYEVELINLTLPNTFLNSAKGGRPIFYPYFYVELQNITAPSSRSDNIIYSNNPHSTKVLFRALLNDSTTLSSSPFIKIDGDGMRHIIKFKPNDSFKVSIKDQDGNLFKSEEQERYSPNYPNPMIQISMCFSFKRI